jgi:ELP3 family radical SAM enzyme/protein acetyltransferase
MKDIEALTNSAFTDPSIYIKEDLLEPLTKFVTDLCLRNYESKKKFQEEIRLMKRKYHINPRNCQISYMYELLVNQKTVTNSKIRKFFKSKHSRGLSGVIVISTITSPYPEYTDKNGKIKKQRFSCKHDCHYCPKEVDASGIEINPRSYLSSEPTVARGLQNNFDPINQFNERATQYHLNGHYVDKIELIVLGGTWTEYPREYQEDFIKKSFWAANTFYQLKKRPILSLTEEQTINETAKSRIIGITLEMRPDSITEEEISWLRYLGCTRVQLGVQHINNKLLKKVNRGCYTIHAEMALKRLKDAAFKVDAHLMPDLPGSTPDEDSKMFNHIIKGTTLQFDQWKVYPTSTVPWTKIKKWYDEGSYMPYTEKDPESLINVLLKMKKKVPQWIRLNRVVRDIPNTAIDGTKYIYAGNKITNLRQVLHKRLEEKGEFCRCIRCREVKKDIALIRYSRCVVRKYLSSGGDEYFLSIESGNHKDSFYMNDRWYYKNKEEPGIIYGFLRLRICNKENYLKNKYFPELEGCGLIRELHVYGQVASSRNTDEKAQHLGLGKILMRKAQKIAYYNNCNKLAVISGVGVRNYYKKLGYKLVNTYMIKNINNNVSCILVGVLNVLFNVLLFYLTYVLRTTTRPTTLRT